MSPVLFCFVFHLGLCFHAFFLNNNALIVYFTEKLDPWEFSDELIIIILIGSSINECDVYFLGTVQFGHQQMVV